MVSVIRPPTGTVVAGVNTRTGCMAAPATPPEVMEVKVMAVVPAMPTASKPADIVVSELDESLKPPAAAA